MSDANKALTSAAASGAVPVDADGSATTVAQILALFPSGQIVTNGFTFNLIGSGWWTNTGGISATGTTNYFGGAGLVQSWDNPTNTWARDTNFPLGTNSFFTVGATTTGVTGLANKSTASERYGQITIVATGDIVFTNPASFRCSDFLASRTITNGNTALVSVDFIPGQCTNLFIVQTK
jgi:hypothetical protein